MAGMTPAFVAKQLGHSVQVLLDTYARWIDSESDFIELDKLSQIKNPILETASNIITT
ncbi:hypothetical protein D3C72_2447410 [compost metagenome]